MKQCPQCHAPALDHARTCACGCEFPPLHTDPSRTGPRIGTLGCAVAAVLLIIGAASLAHPHASSGLAFTLFAAVFVALAIPFFRTAHPRLSQILFGMLLVVLGTLSLRLALVYSMCSFMGKPAP